MVPCCFCPSGRIGPQCPLLWTQWRAFPWGSLDIKLSLQTNYGKLFLFKVLSGWSIPSNLVTKSNKIMGSLDIVFFCLVCFITCILELYVCYIVFSYLSNHWPERLTYLLCPLQRMTPSQPSFYHITVPTVLSLCSVTISALSRKTSANRWRTSRPRYEVGGRWEGKMSRVGE